ncbi:MAG: DNA-binding domain-containing protein [Methyloglobulus sp.]|nr:DNA-binding domain-containing protein [Methyloglobulus sp.]
MKLGLHQRTEGGLNVHKYRISGKNNSGTVMGVLLKDRQYQFCYFSSKTIRMIFL